MADDLLAVGFDLGRVAQPLGAEGTPMTVADLLWRMWQHAPVICVVVIFLLADVLMELAGAWGRGRR